MAAPGVSSGFADLRLNPSVKPEVLSDSKAESKPCLVRQVSRREAEILLRRRERKRRQQRRRRKMLARLEEVQDQRDRAWEELDDTTQLLACITTCLSVDAAFPSDLGARLAAWHAANFD